MANKRISELGTRVPSATDLMLIGDPTTGYSFKATLLSIVADRVPYTGATGNVNLGDFGLSSGYISFDVTPTSTPVSQGTMYWDDANETVALIMNGTTQRVGLDSFFMVKNSTGATIAKGTAVGFAGTDGASGHLLIKKFIANGTEPSQYYMGVTSEEILNGGFGKVTKFGKLQGVNTSAFANGNILYVSTTVAGAFQTAVPVAPNNIIVAAAVISSGNNGTLMIRETLGSNINNDEGVKITSPANGQVLKYNSTTSLWENANEESLAGYVPYTGATANVNLGSYNLASSKLTQSGASSFETFTANGQYQLFATSGNGLVLSGQGSVNDLAMLNKNGDSVFSIKTGTTIGSFANTLLIGTTTDNLSGAKLQVSGAGTFSGDVGIGTISPVSIANYRVQTINGTNGSILYFQANGTNSLRLIGEGADAYIDNLSTGSLLFRTGSTPSTKLTIASTGAATFSSSVTAPSLTASGTSATVNINRLAGGTQPKLSFQDASAEFAYIQASGATGVVRYDAGPSASWGGSHAFYTDQTLRFTIASTGATFSSSVTAGGDITISNASAPSLFLTNSSASGRNYRVVSNNSGLFVIQRTGIADLIFVNDTGNLGIGVTPSANTLSVGIDLSQGAGLFGYSNSTYLTANAYYNAGWKYKATDAASRYEQYLGTHAWLTAPSGTAGNAITFTQAMTLDASGRLGIGTSSPANYGGWGGLDVRGGNGGHIIVANTGGTNRGEIYTDGNGFNVSAQTSNALLFKTGDAERMRITSSGYVLVGSIPVPTTDLLQVAGSASINGSILLSSGYKLFGNATSGSTSSFISLYNATDGGIDLMANFSTSKITFGTAGSERMRISATGNVGIGTSSPTSVTAGRITQTIRGASSELLLQSSSATDGTSQGFGIVAGGVDAYFVNRLDGSYYWITGAGGNTTRMTLNASGYLLLGNIPVPTTDLLQVAGSGRINAGANGSAFTASYTANDGGINSINSGTLANGRTAQIRLTNGTTFFGANDRTYQLINVGTSASAADFAIQYWNGSTYLERFRIGSSGDLTFSNVPTSATASTVANYLSVTVNGNSYLIPLHSTP